MHPQRRLEEPQVEEEEEEVELVPNCQPIGLHSSAVYGGESELSRPAGPGAAVPATRLEPVWYEQWCSHRVTYIK